MKEFDYSKWNNKPREMWVWNEDESKKVKRFVVYIREIDINYDTNNKVLCNNAIWYEHCAEIETTRRMTNYELAHWLWKGSQVGEFREVSCLNSISTKWIYNSVNENTKIEKVDECDIKIRVNGGEWKEPLIEE